MPLPHICPDAATIEQFLLGRLPEPERRQLEDHLRACEPCADTVEAVKAEDTLVEAVRLLATSSRVPETPVVRDLIERVRNMHASDTLDTGKAPLTPPPTDPHPPYAFLTAPQRADEIGRLGGYRVLRELGKGGMGLVFQAEDERLRRRIALKVVKPEAAAGPGARERFLREARSVAALEHDHIVPVYQSGEDNGVLFLAMPLLKGQTLHARLAQAPRPSPAELLRVGREVAEALAAAHAAGIVHRDVKPGNLWLEGPPDEPLAWRRVKVLDFGLARPVEGDDVVTSFGKLLGTPAYMAPEQALGGEVDARGDLFSLGCVLYEMATGQRPFTGKTAAAVLAELVAHEPPPARTLNPAVPPALSDLIGRLLSKDPSGRPTSARALAAELANIERSATEARPPASGRTRRAWPVAAGFLLLLAASVAGVVIIIRKPTGEEVGRLTVPRGTTIEVRPGNDPPETTVGRPSAPAPAIPAAGKQVFPFTRSLSSRSLVARPAVLPGVRSWGLETKNPRGTAGHFGGALVALSPDGATVAQAGIDASVRIWDVKSGQLRRVLVKHGPLSDLAWSPDGKMLASAGNDGTYLWDSSTGQILHYLQANSSAGIAWSPNGKLLAATGDRLRLWDTTSGKSVAGFSTALGQVVWKPDGDTIMCWGSDGVDLHFAFFDLKLPSKELQKYRMVGPGHPSIKIALSPSGKNFALSNEPSQVFDTETGKAIPLQRKDWAGTEAVSWTPDEKYLAVANGHDLQLCDPKSGKALRTVKIGLVNLAGRMSWSRDGKRLAVSGKSETSGVLLVLDIESGQPAFRAESHPCIHNFSWSPDGRRVACDQYGAGTRCWDLLLGKEIGVADSDYIHCFSPDGKVLAVYLRRENRVRFLDSTTLQSKSEQVFPMDVSSLSWSPDGKMLALTHPHDKKISLWETAQRKTIRTLETPTETPTNFVVSSTAWSPDGAVLAYIGEGEIRLWDPQTGKEIRKQAWPEPWVSSMEWSMDGKTLMTYGPQYGVVHAWDVMGNNGPQRFDEGRQFAGMKRLPRQDVLQMAHLREAAVSQRKIGEARVAHLCKLPHDLGPGLTHFSPDGRLVGSVLDSIPGQGPAATIFVWKTRNGQPTGALVPLPRERWLAVSPEGHYRCSPGVQNDLVYVVETDDGRQETLIPAEFARCYGWTNDPNNVRPLGDPKEDSDDVESFPSPEKAVVLCDGGSLDAWEKGTAKLAGRGAMEAGTDDLVTKQKFGGRFRLHVEFRIPERADSKTPGPARSGLLVQGRYLLALTDSHGRALDSSDSCGALVRVKAPALQAARPAGAWQSLEVELEPAVLEGDKVKEPAKLSAWHNDFLIHDKVPVQPTARAYDEKVGEPGPEVLLGNEEGVQFRNVWLLPLAGKE